MDQKVIRCGLLPAELIKRILGRDVDALPVCCFAERMWHIEERHPPDVPYIHQAIQSGIIQNPDYVGYRDGPSPGYSFVKKLDRLWRNRVNIPVDKVFISVILNQTFKDNYNVLTAYGLDDGSFSSRIRNGTLKEVLPVQEPAPPPPPPVVSDIPTAAQLLAAQWGAKLRRSDSRNSPN